MGICIIIVFDLTEKITIIIWCDFILETCFVTLKSIRPTYPPRPWYHWYKIVQSLATTKNITHNIMIIYIRLYVYDFYLLFIIYVKIVPFFFFIYRFKQYTRNIGNTIYGYPPYRDTPQNTHYTGWTKFCV